MSFRIASSPSLASWIASADRRCSLVRLELEQASRQPEHRVHRCTNLVAHHRKKFRTRARSGLRGIARLRERGLVALAVSDVRIGAHETAIGKRGAVNFQHRPVWPRALVFGRNVAPLARHQPRDGIRRQRTAAEFAAVMLMAQDVERVELGLEKALGQPQQFDRTTVDDRHESRRIAHHDSLRHVGECCVVLRFRSGEVREPQFVAQRHEIVAAMHSLDAMPRVQHDHDRGRKIGDKLDVGGKTLRCQCVERNKEDADAGHGLRGDPAQRNIRHDRRGKGSEQPGEQVALAMRRRRQPREIAGHDHERDHWHDHDQTEHPHRTPPRQQADGAKTNHRQDDTAHNHRVDNVLRDHERIDPDAQEIDHCDEDQPGPQVPIASAPGRGLILILKFGRQPQQRRTRL